jgi:hypothetical protein
MCIGFDNDSFAMLPTRIVEGNGDECIICMVAMVTGDKVCDLPACGHTFHLSCISHWFMVKLRTGSVGRCPLCNTTVVIPSNEFPTVPTATAVTAVTTVVEVLSPQVEPPSTNQACHTTLNIKTVVCIILVVMCLSILLITTGSVVGFSP